MDGIEVKKTATTTNYLPHVIIENILCRLPVKSLLRFVAVCKQWKATISDREFATTHLRLSEKSSCLLRLREGGVNKQAEIVDIRNHEFRLLSTVDAPPLVSHKSILCHYDGLYIIECDCRNEVYALWNPSRRSYKILDYSFDSLPSLVCGICYDPLVKDYKIVFGNEYRYAVYYCRSNSWSDLKESNRDLRTLVLFALGSCYAVTLQGSIYWVCLSLKLYRYVIVYFDGKDEKLKILRELGNKAADIIHARLIPKVDDVGFYIVTYSKDAGHFLLIMKKEVGEDEWMESKVEVPQVNDGVGVVSLWPICRSGDDKIVFYDEDDQYLLFDVAKRSFSRLQNFTQFKHGDLFPYVENLLWY